MDLKYLIFRPLLTRYWRKQFKNQNSETWNQKSATRIRYQKSQIAIPENLKSTIEKSEIKKLISEMPLVISSADNHGLSQFAMNIKLVLYILKNDFKCSSSMYSLILFQLKSFSYQQLQSHVNHWNAVLLHFCTNILVWHFSCCHLSQAQIYS